MKILALSGSGRAISTNTALLRALAATAPAHQITVYASLHELPVFSPDLEAAPLPAAVETLLALIREADGLVIASPEYIRSIPGGLKNAIDWLVSRDEIIAKPIALLHASHRGDDMLDQLRLVLSTVSSRFAPELFLRFNLMKQSPDQIAQHLSEPAQRQALTAYLQAFTTLCAR
jgi:chromate reductase, NAD(P)H dehydrogenase (quinone)